jgi:quercetin dioxygenase-like cupin family protein
MPIEVFDFRRDIRHLIITPEIRARFLRLEVGQVASRHSHDLGHEVFLILQGRCEFEIDGETAVLEPGQLCIARIDQLHRVRNVGDEPVVMYLSVTPHVEPTHSYWDEHGRKLPPRYGSLRSGYRAELPAPTESIETLAGRVLADATAFGAIAHTAGVEIEGPLTALQDALRTGDRLATKNALDAVWAEIFRVHESLRRLDEDWNELAVRASGEPTAS